MALKLMEEERIDALARANNALRLEHAIVKQIVALSFYGQPIPPETIAALGQAAAASDEAIKVMAATTQANGNGNHA